MSYIVRNNVKYATGGSGGGNLNIVKLTQAEYDALPDSKNSDGILYAIEDGEISSSGGSAKAITISQEDFDKLSEEEKANGIYVIPDGEDLTAKNLFYDGSETGLGNTVQDAIDEQNKNFEWKLVGEVTGETEIDLPNTFNELSVMVRVKNNQCYKLNVLKEELSSDTRLFFTGGSVMGDASHSYGVLIEVAISINKLQLTDALFNDGGISINYRSEESITSVYYR